MSFKKKEVRTHREGKNFNSGEHNANGQRMFSKETERTRGDKRESKKIISTTGHLTATNP